MENSLSPQEQMARMLTGYWTSQAVQVAAKLGIADLLKSGPRCAADLAAETSCNADAMYRLLRALASVGVFAEGKPREFSLTPLAETLRSDVPGSQRAMAIMMGDEHYATWGGLLQGVQTGEIVFDKIYGKPIFEFLDEDPDKGRVFDEAMTSIHGRESGAVLDAYDFSGIGILADVGGGNGSNITAILAKYPSMQGILFDMPHVVERANERVNASGVGERCELIGGNFFQSVPSGADAYFMRHIIHDWDDAKSLTILRNCHRAMPVGGKLLLVESVVPPGNGPAFSKFLDLNMMLIPGGKERTEEEYQALYQAAGFELTRIVPTALEVCVIEGARK